MTVTGTTAPVSSKIWVIPSLRPMIPAIARTRLIHLDLDVHSGREVQLRQGVDGLRPRRVNVDDALVRLQLELLAALLVDVRRAQHRPALHTRRQRDRPAHPRTGFFRRTDDVRCGLVDHRVIERLESDPDLPSYCSSSLTLSRAAPAHTRAASKAGSGRIAPVALTPGSR